MKKKAGSKVKGKAKPKAKAAKAKKGKKAKYFGKIEKVKFAPMTAVALPTNIL